MGGSSRKDKAADANGLFHRVGFGMQTGRHLKGLGGRAFHLTDRSSLLDTMLAPWHLSDEVPHSKEAGCGES